MKVLSLFDGISCGMVALKQCDIQVDEYIAYEIDNFPIEISKKNFPEIKHCGNVFDADFHQYRGFDLLIGGSPCTYWSSARAKGTGREITPDGIGGKLFMQFVKALKEVKPNYFLYENNNSMSKEIKNFITEQLGVKPVMINSNYFVPQVRRRLYWTNIPFELPTKECEIQLKDILQDKVDDKYTLSEKMTKYAMSSGTKNFFVKPEINLRQARPLTTAPNKRAGTTTYVSVDFKQGGVQTL